MFLFNLLSETWFWWGLGLAILVPLAAIILSEWGYRFEKVERKEAVGNVLGIRNIILPLLALELFLVQVSGFARSDFAIKLLETVIWISVLNVILLGFNIFLFSEADKTSWRAQVPKLFLDLTRFVLVMIGAAIVLSTVWQADLGGFLTALGVGSIVIGLALQDTLSNIVSGIALLFERPFRVGDWLMVDGQVGKVLEMNWRAIRIENRNNEVTVVPNVVLAQEKFQNLDPLNAIHWHSFYMGYGYEIPPNQVKQILKTTILNTPIVLQEPAPTVRVHEYADSAITYHIRFAIEDYVDLPEVRDDVMTRIWYASKRFQLNIPYPIQTLYHEATQSDETSLRPSQDGLKQVPAFMALDDEETKQIATAMKQKDFGQGEVLIQQGQKGHAIFVIVKGEAIIYLETAKHGAIEVATLHAGDIFGETTLLNKKKSSVTVVAQTDLEVLEIEPSVIDQLIYQNTHLASSMDDVMELHRKMVRSALKNKV